MLTALRTQAAKDSTGALVRWRAAVREAADPANTKPASPATIRELAELLGIDEIEDPLDAFEGDVAAVERVARLAAGVELLDAQIAAAVKPFGSLDKFLRAVEQARAELARLEGIAADIASFQTTKGYEAGAIARAKSNSPRMFPN